MSTKFELFLQLLPACFEGNEEARSLVGNLFPEMAEEAEEGITAEVESFFAEPAEMRFCDVCDTMRERGEDGFCTATGCMNDLTDAPLEEPAAEPETEPDAPAKDDDEVVDPAPEQPAETPAEPVTEEPAKDDE